MACKPKQNTLYHNLRLAKTKLYDTEVLPKVRARQPTLSLTLSRFLSNQYVKLYVALISLAAGRLHMFAPSLSKFTNVQINLNMGTPQKNASKCAS